MRRWGRTNSAYCRAPRCPRRLVPGLGRCSRNVVASRVGAAAGPVSHADDAFVARGDRYGRAHLRRTVAACDEDPAGVRHSNPSGLPRRSLMMGNPAQVGLFRSAARWLWSPKQRSDDEQLQQAAYGCPVCDHELPALRPGARGGARARTVLATADQGGTGGAVPRPWTIAVQRPLEGSRWSRHVWPRCAR